MILVPPLIEHLQISYTLIASSQHPRKTRSFVLYGSRLSSIRHSMFRKLLLFLDVFCLVVTRITLYSYLALQGHESSS